MVRYKNRYYVILELYSNQDYTTSAVKAKGACKEV